MRPISSAQRDNILSLASSGHSIRKIATQLNIPKSTVGEYLQNLVPGRSTTKTGRPSRLSPTDKHAVVNQILTGKAENAAQVTKHINTIIPTPVSSDTVRRVLKKHSFKAVVKKKKPLLSARHRKRRLEFALKYREWTVEDWKRIIWSDETKINKFGSDGRQWVWKQKGQGLIQREVQGTVKHGGGNIMVWGCMGWNGVGQMVEVEGKMDANQYVDILEDHMLPSLEESGIPEDEVIFQQDNDPKHTSKKAQKWMEDHNITLLDWPAHLLTLVLLNINGFISKRSLQNIQQHQKGFGSCGRE